MHPSSALQVLSVNVGLPRAVVWKGRTVVTGIFKEPVARRVAIRRLNLEGDRQADLTVHGGPEKAVYAYPAEYYAFGTKEFLLSDIPMQLIVDRVAAGDYQAKPAEVFPFEQIADAHRLMESNSANGKIVVVR
jgi:NADPH:quinone reductase-like Zn-dependent oxidoreductase